MEAAVAPSEGAGPSEPAFSLVACPPPRQRELFMWGEMYTMRVSLESSAEIYRP